MARGNKQHPHSQLPRSEREKRQKFLPRAARVWGVSEADAEAMLSRPRKSSLWLNRLGDRDPQRTLESLGELGAEVQPIPWCDGGYFLLGDSKSKVAESPLFENGDVYIQNASSFVPVIALNAQPGDCILDLCAAPGGKACHIASRLGNTAKLWLNDAMKPRVQKMEKILATYGVQAETITQHQGQYADKFIDARFDRILLDAQCSGEGMLDLSHPNAMRYWGMERITKYSRLQQKMLVAAFKLLVPGGTLVYSTCTIAPEENEAPVDHLLRHHPAEIAPIEPPDGGEISGRQAGLKSWDARDFNPALTAAVRVRPSEFMEAFFVCKIRKAVDA